MKVDLIAYCLHSEPIRVFTISVQIFKNFVFCRRDRNFKDGYFLEMFQKGKRLLFPRLKLAKRITMKINRSRETIFTIACMRSSKGYSCHVHNLDSFFNSVRKSTLAEFTRCMNLTNAHQKLTYSVEHSKSKAFWKICVHIVSVLCLLLSQYRILFFTFCILSSYPVLFWKY